MYACCSHTYCSAKPVLGCRPYSGTNSHTPRTPTPLPRPRRSVSADIVNIPLGSAASGRDHRIQGIRRACTGYGNTNGVPCAPIYNNQVGKFNNGEGAENGLCVTFLESRQLWEVVFSRLDVDKGPDLSLRNPTEVTKHRPRTLQLGTGCTLNLLS